MDKIKFVNNNSAGIPCETVGIIFGTKTDINTGKTTYVIRLAYPLIKYLDKYWKEQDIDAIDMTHPVYEFITFVECDLGDFKREGKYKNHASLF